MTLPEREQQAREFLRDTLGLPVVAWEDIHATVKLLADTERATLERATQAVQDEEELDDDMPDEMFQAITGGCRALAIETLRAVVRATKKSIAARIKEIPS